MVKLTQIDDEQDFVATSNKEVPIIDSDVESDSDDELDETVYERIVALKDIVPPQQRDQVASTVSTVYNAVYGAVSKAGNWTWVLTTSTLLLGVPLTLSILAEQQLLELEKEFKLQAGANDILAAGEETQPSQPSKIY